MRMALETPSGNLNTQLGESRLLKMRYRSVKCFEKPITQPHETFFIVPICGFSDVVRNFRKDSIILHFRSFLTLSLNCSNVSPEDGSRKNAAQRSSNSCLSAWVTSDVSNSWAA